VGPIYSILKPKATRARTQTMDESSDDSEDDDFTTALEEVPSPN
jgi:hypothetical protein